jgi:hypothetical protein
MENLIIGDSHLLCNFKFASAKSQAGTARQASQQWKVNQMNADTIGENILMLFATCKAAIKRVNAVLLFVVARRGVDNWSNIITIR